MSGKIGILGGDQAALLAGSFQAAGIQTVLYQHSQGYQDAFAGCDLVVDLSQPDEYEAKCAVVAALDEALPAQAVIVPVTIFLNVNRLAAAAHNRARVVPAHLVFGGELEIAELVKTMETDEAAYQAARAAFAPLVERVVDAPDALGGIYYRMLPLMPNISARLVDQGTTAEDIDKGMRYGTNFSRLPLRMADAFGLDNIVRLLEDIYQETKNQAFRPHPRLLAMVAAGKLGVKSGEGFYRYEKEGAQ
jgi:3-hydroxybutyryl-CoA dehydrogenase